MLNKQELQQKANLVLDTLTKEQRTDGMYSHLSLLKWEWPTGVALYGIYQYYKKTGSEKFKKVLLDWYDYQLQQEPVHRNVNTVAPLFTLACLYEEAPRPEWKPVLDSWMEWVTQTMPRTEGDGLQHMTVLEENKGQLWADTLFMAVLFLAKYGMVFNRPDLVEQAKYQYLLHIQYLQQTSSGLWYHGWSFERKDNFAGALWARGNSWFTSGAMVLFDIIGYNAQDAASKMIMQAWQRQTAAMLAVQHSNGLFGTLLDQPESYVETSATAGIAFGWLTAVQQGFFASELTGPAQKAAQAVIGQINSEGIVENVSYGTGMGHTLQHYLDIPIFATGYGQGLTILMITACL